MNDAQIKTISRALGLEDETDYPMEEVDDYLERFNSYGRAEAICLLMRASPPRRCLEIYLAWGNTCDDPWLYRSDLAKPLRRALAEVALPEVLGPDELSFYTQLPEWVPIWRGCERRRERGLSWTNDRAVAQQFARGMRCVNGYPTLASAEIHKQHIFAVFLDRDESELVVDPRQLRKLRAEPHGVA
jgi:hypothetical protein